MIAAYGSAFWPVIDWVEDQDNVITIEPLDRLFGPTGAEPVEDVQEKSEQVHVAFLELTESESFDVVLGAAPPGLEALRRLVRRWDPLSGGKRRARATKSWFWIDANYKIFPQDLRNGKNWSADNRVERRQQLLMRTPIQPHLKPLCRVSWNNILP